MAKQTPEKIFEEYLANAAPDEAQAEQVGKRLFRSVLRKMGGCSPDELAKSFKKNLNASGGGKGIRPYDLRGAVTTDMMRSGMGHLELRYLTGHSCTDILNEYASLDIDTAIAQYFKTIEPLLMVMTKRLNELMPANKLADQHLVCNGAADYNRAGQV